MTDNREEEGCMSRLNITKLSNLLAPRTHEGAPAKKIGVEAQLRRSVLGCLLWEVQFYEDGVEIAARIAELVPKLDGQRKRVGRSCLADKPLSGVYRCRFCPRCGRNHFESTAKRWVTSPK